MLEMREGSEKGESGGDWSGGEVEVDGVPAEIAVTVPVVPGVPEFAAVPGVCNCKKGWVCSKRMVRWQIVQCALSLLR